MLDLNAICHAYAIGTQAPDHLKVSGPVSNCGLPGSAQPRRAA